MEQGVGNNLLILVKANICEVVFCTMTITRRCVMSVLLLFIYNYLFFDNFYLRFVRYDRFIKRSKGNRQEERASVMWSKLFRKRKSQTVMIFLVVLLCTTLLNGAMTILTSLNEPYDELKEECHPADLEVFIYSNEKSVVDSYKEKFQDMKEVEKIVETPYVYIEDEIYVGDKKIKAYMDLITYSSEIYKDIRLVEGSTDVEEAMDAGKCFIPACVKNEYHLNVGDVLDIQNPEGVISYEIAGVFAEPYSTSTAFDSAVLVKKLPSQIKKTQYILKMYAQDGYTGDDIKAAYQKENTGIFPGFLSTVDGMIANGLIAVHIVSALFLAIGIIMLVVSGLIINFMVRHAMISDAKSIAVYKTIGYTTGTILQMYLMFYLVIAAAASVIGVFTSKILAGLVLNGLFVNLGQASEIHVFKTGIWCALGVIVFILLIVYSVIRKTKNVKPVYALNGLKTSNTKKKHYHGKTNISFSPFGIAWRNIVRDKKGVIGILITVAVTIFSVNFGIISLDVAFSQKNNNDYWIGVDPSDVIVNVSDSQVYKEVEQIVKSDNGVDSYFNVVQNQRVLLDWDRIDVTPSISAFVYEDYDKVTLPLTEGRNPRNEKEIAIGTVVAREQGKEVGDYLTCYLDQDTKVNLLITGLFQTYYQMGDACRLCQSAYEKNNVELGCNMCSIYLKDGVEKDTFMDELSEKLGNRGEVIPRTEEHASIMNMIVNPQIQGIPPVIALAFIIGAMNIFCIVVLKNATNEKNNGIYKSIGYSTSDLMLSNLFYVGMIAVCAIAVAVPISIVTYPSIMKVALGMFGFRSYPMTVHVAHLILGNGCAFVLFLVSALLSSRSIRKIDVRDLVIE